MKNLTLLLLIVLMMACCKSTQILPTKTSTTITKDSTYTTLKVVDTVQVLRAADTAKITMLINQLSKIPTVIKSNQATISLRKIDNEIQAECICKELKQAVKLYKETVIRQTETITTQKETIIVLQNQMSFLQKIFFYIGLVVALIVIAFISKAFIKP